MIKSEDIFKRLHIDNIAISILLITLGLFIWIIGSTATASILFAISCLYSFHAKVELDDSSRTIENIVIVLLLIIAVIAGRINLINLQALFLFASSVYITIKNLLDIIKTV